MATKNQHIVSQALITAHNGDMNKAINILVVNFDVDREAAEKFITERINTWTV